MFGRFHFISELSRFRRDRRGSIILAVFVLVLSVLGASFAAYRTLMSYERLRTRDQVVSRLIVESALDYAINSVKNRWCLNEGLAPNSQCQENGLSNTDRLVVSEQLLRGRLRVTSLEDVSPDPRRPVVASADFSELTTQHPLYFAVAQLTRKEQNSLGVCIVAERLNSTEMAGYAQYLPAASGDQLSYLRIRAMLTRSSGSCSPDTNTSPSAETFLFVFPRELNQFALVLADDLDLATATSNGLGASGDMTIPAYDNLEDRQDSQHRGVQFKSPVFVNGDLVYPDSFVKPEDEAEVVAYPHVHFEEPVYLAGQIRLAEQFGSIAFHPKSAGGPESSWWTSLPYSGLQQGVRLETRRDLGLDVLSEKIEPTGAANSELFEACLHEAQVSAELEKTNGSSLILKQTKTPATGMEAGKDKVDFEFRLGLSHDNQFVGMPFESESFARDRSQPCDLGSDGRCREVSWAVSGERLEKGEGCDDRKPTFQVALEARLGSSWVRGSAYLTSCSTLEVPLEIKERSSASSARFTPDNARIRIQSTPFKIDSQEQPDQQTLQVSLLDFQGNLDEVRVNIHPYGFGYSEVDGHWRRSGPKPMGNLIFTASGLDGEPRAAHFATDETGFWRTTPFAVSGVGSTEVQVPIPSEWIAPSDEENRGALLAQCQDSSQWNRHTGSFLAQTEESWNFARPSGTEDFTGLHAIFDSGANDSFQVFSIADSCTIEASAERMFGFLHCHDLTIEARSRPLTFVGTLIVTGDVQVDRSAVDVGMVFSSIHTSFGREKLRTAGILRRPDDSVSAIPWWHPYQNISRHAQISTSLATTLREQAIPFQWTMVTPDCGNLPGVSEKVCDRDQVNFVASQVGRRIKL